MRTNRLTLCLLLLVALALPALAGDLSIKQVWPEKICYKPGETATITVTVANAGATAVADLPVDLAIVWGLDNRDQLPVQKVNVPAKGEGKVTFSYPVPQDRKWGHEAVATVTDASGAVSGHEYFTVGNNPWEVGHYLTCFGLRGAKKGGQIDNSLLPRFRKSYTTCIEAYSVLPSQFDDMTPGSETWRSGQGWYTEGKSDWQYMVQRAHENGMAVVTYIQYFGYGPEAFDFTRRHPDWLTYDKTGRPNAWFDVDQLTNDRYEPESQPPHTPGGITTGQFLPSKQMVGDYWIAEMGRSKDMFGWDGFRSDGTPGVVGGYDVNGKLEELPNPGVANTEFVRKFRRELTAKYPDFLFGWNNVAGGYPQMYNSETEEDAMLPNAYSLYEFFRGASQPNVVYHAWKKGASYLQQECAAIRKRGGFSHAGWMASNRYLEAMASASGVQVDGWADPSAVNWPEYRRFEFRWGEYLWDCNLRYVRPAADAVKVAGPASVWWEDLVNARDLPGGGKRVVVNLINLPEKDDDGWADKAPAPATNVKVTFAAPAGKKLVKVVALSPDVPGDVIAVTPAADGSVTIPQVSVWTVVVAEFK
ncbi:MAG TPA: hypothetical protein VGM19_00530 [Armatimonadota bacterium]|jgi:hypothetical protein